MAATPELLPDPLFEYSSPEKIREEYLRVSLLRGIPSEKDPGYAVQPMYTPSDSSIQVPV